MNPYSYEDSLFVDPTIIIPDDPIDQRYLIKSRYEQVAQAINARDISIYDTAEFETGQRWFTVGDTRSFRQGFRIVIHTGDLTSGAVTVAHEIENLKYVSHAWGTGIKLTSGVPTNWYPLPYASTVANGNISIEISSTSVIVTPGAAAPTVNDSYVVLEYLTE